MLVQQPASTALPASRRTPTSPRSSSSPCAFSRPALAPPGHQTAPPTSGGEPCRPWASWPPRTWPALFRQNGPSEPASPARPHLAWPGHVGAHGRVFHVEHRQSAPPAPRRDAVVRPSEACASRSCRRGARCGWVCSQPRMMDDEPRPLQACRQGERPCAPAARQARWCANRLAPEAPWHSMPATPQGRDCVPSVARRAWTWPPVRSATRTTTPRGRLAAVPLHGPD